MVLRDFDHIVLAARDLEAQAGFYEGLGFTLTPRAQHPWGTTNRLIQMQGVFLELLSLGDLAIAPPAPGQFSFGAFTRAYLAQREGIAMLVLRTADAAADRALWQGRGLQTYELFDFSRSATLPDGRSVTVAFTLCFVTDPQMRDALFFVCQQHYPENFWKPEFQVHPNGATGILSLQMVADDPQQLRSFFARLTDEQAVESVPDGLRVRMNSGVLEIFHRNAMKARMPGHTDRTAAKGAHFVGLEVSVDVPRARGIMQKSAIAYRDTGTALHVEPAVAFGTTLLLSGAESARPT